MARAKKIKIIAISAVLIIGGGISVLLALNTRQAEQNEEEPAKRQVIVYVSNVLIPIIVDYKS